MDLSSYYAANGLIGTSTGAAAAGIAHLYLTDEHFTVLSAARGKDDLAPGEALFSRYPVARSARPALAKCLCAADKRSLLLLAGKEPILIVGALRGAAGILPVIVPGGEMRELLGAPAALCGLSENVTVVPTAAGKYRKFTDGEIERVREFVRTVTHPFSPFPSTLTGGALLSALAARAAQLAGLVGAPLEYDLSGFGMRATDRILSEWAVGVLFAVLTAAARTAGEKARTVRAYIDRGGTGEPMMHLSFWREDTETAFAEFLPLAQKARERGAIFDAVVFPDRPHEVQVRASLSPVELSAEGIKEKHELLAGDAPTAPSVIPIPEAVRSEYELSFDEADGVGGQSQ